VTGKMISASRPSHDRAGHRSTSVRATLRQRGGRPRVASHSAWARLWRRYDFMDGAPGSLGEILLGRRPSGRAPAARCPEEGRADGGAWRSSTHPPRPGERRSPLVGLMSQNRSRVRCSHSFASPTVPSPTRSYQREAEWILPPRRASVASNQATTWRDTSTGWET
jgi:hypothetical protein